MLYRRDLLNATLTVVLASSFDQQVKLPLFYNV